MTRAAVMYEFGAPLSIDTLELNPPREGEVVIRVAASGVCHTDLSVIEAKLPYPPPVVLGHEAAGIVEEVGSAVTHLSPGDRVVVGSIPTCGSCWHCTHEQGHLCGSGVEAAQTGGEFVYQKDGAPVARFTGVGSFAERTVINGSAAVKVPDDIPLERACLLGCAVVTGTGAAINTARVRPGDTVAVFGCGGVGVNVIQGAAIADAGRIIAVDLSAKKLEWASQFGATDTLEATGDEISEAIKELTGGVGVDHAFEAIGVPEVMLQAFHSIRRGGQLVVVGVPGFGVELALPACLIPLEERHVIGSLYGSTHLQRDIPRLVDHYRQGRLKLDELVSGELPLSEVNTAFDRMREGSALRTVIVHDA